MDRTFWLGSDVFSKVKSAITKLRNQTKNTWTLKLPNRMGIARPSNFGLQPTTHPPTHPPTQFEGVWYAQARPSWPSWSCALRRSAMVKLELRVVHREVPEARNGWSQPGLGLAGGGLYLESSRGALSSGGGGGSVRVIKEGEGRGGVVLRIKAAAGLKHLGQPTSRRPGLGLGNQIWAARFLIPREK